MAKNTLMEELAEDIASKFGEGRDVPATTFQPHSKIGPGSRWHNLPSFEKPPPCGSQVLLNYISNVWVSGNVPAEWRESVIVPILKKGKPVNDIRSYRPMSLNSCIAKLTERMLLRRLSWYLEAKTILPDQMTGFRTHLSGADALLDFISDVDSATKCKKRAAAVYFDVECAFNTVSTNIVMQALGTANIAGRPAVFIHGFLSDRTFRVRLGTTLSLPRRQNLGLPQGCRIRTTSIGAAPQKGFKECPRHPSLCTKRGCVRGGPSPALLPLVTHQLLRQITRLHKTVAGKSLIARVQSRTHSRFAATTRTFTEVVPTPPAMPRQEPPWTYTEVRGELCSAGVKKKSQLSDTVVQRLAAECLHNNHGQATHVYTDANVDKQAGIIATAYCIPSLKLNCAESLVGELTSTDAELLAITEALKAAEHRNLLNIVIITDSRGAISRIKHHYERWCFAGEARMHIVRLQSRGTAVSLQWMPSHKGIPGNDHADSLAKAAARTRPKVKAPPSNFCCSKSIRGYVWMLHPGKRTRDESSPPLCATGGLSRAEASLLLRIRSRSAYTRAHVFKLGRTPNPGCPHCRETDTEEHVIMDCPATSEARRRVQQTVQPTGKPDLEEIVYPRGNLHRRKLIQRALLDFFKVDWTHKGDCRNT
ncbi:uncharacterized protein LOC135388840 [Ornithodoros turicata]|uniref:uncharacterized protein LOC135388840 n=1 Tax=Ornithodoros turicata TaxID=34597 RepID=UPI00313904EB